MVRNEVTAKSLTVYIIRKNWTGAKAVMWANQGFTVPRSQPVSYGICEHLRSECREGRAWWLQNRQNGLHFTCESTETTKKDSVETENFLKSYDLPLVSRCHLGEKVEVRKFFQKEIQTSFLPPNETVYNRGDFFTCTWKAWNYFGHQRKQKWQKFYICYRNRETKPCIIQVVLL